MNYVEEIGRLDKLRNSRRRFVFLAALACIIALFFTINSIVAGLSSLELPSFEDFQAMATAEPTQAVSSPEPSQNAESTARVVSSPTPSQETFSNTEISPSDAVLSDAQATRRAQGQAVQGAIRGTGNR